MKQKLDFKIDFSQVEKISDDFRLDSAELSEFVKSAVEFLNVGKIESQAGTDNYFIYSEHATYWIGDVFIQVYVKGSNTFESLMLDVFKDNNCDLECVESVQIAYNGK